MQRRTVLHLPVMQFVKYCRQLVEYLETFFPSTVKQLAVENISFLNGEMKTVVPSVMEQFQTIVPSMVENSQ